MKECSCSSHSSLAVERNDSSDEAVLTVVVSSSNNGAVVVLWTTGKSPHAKESNGKAGFGTILTSCCLAFNASS